MCPAFGTVDFNEYQVCVIDWFMKRSNAYLNVTQLQEAVRHPPTCPSDRSGREAGGGGETSAPRTAAGLLCPRPCQARSRRLPCLGTPQAPLCGTTGVHPRWPPCHAAHATLARPRRLPCRPSHSCLPSPHTHGCAQVAVAIEHQKVWHGRLLPRYAVEQLDLGERSDKDMLDVV